jgi:hypothetical protein
MLNPEAPKISTNGPPRLNRSPLGRTGDPMSNLRRMTPKRLEGPEAFRSGGRTLGFGVLGFWQWSASDLVSNATRGRLAEFVVAQALGIPTSGVRDEWAAYDLETPEGIKVEVKSSAYLQSWAQRQPSSVIFSVRKTRAWDPDSNRLRPPNSCLERADAKSAFDHADVVTADQLWPGAVCRFASGGSWGSF